MAVPYALGEGTEQDRCIVDSLREAIRLKDSLYSKASVETLAKYNAEFGNDQLQEENHFVSRSRTYYYNIEHHAVGGGRRPGIAPAPIDCSAEGAPPA